MMFDGIGEPGLDVLSLYLGHDGQWAKQECQVADVFQQAIALGCARVKLIILGKSVPLSLVMAISSGASTCGLGVDVKASLATVAPMQHSSKLFSMELRRSPQTAMATASRLYCP